MIGQYYRMYRHGVSAGCKLSEGFESFQEDFYRRGADFSADFPASALIYHCDDDYYLVAREEIDGDDAVLHGFLFPRELFREKAFGDRLYRFFDIADFDCTVAGFEKAASPPALPKLRVAAGAGDFLRPEDVFRRGRERPRFIRLLLYATILALTEDVALVFSLPQTEIEPFRIRGELLVRSLFALIPRELREHLTFHTCVSRREALGRMKIAVTPLPPERLPRNNKLIYFDFLRFEAGPDLVIEQKTRGRLLGPLLFAIWEKRDEKALAALFYLAHHNRDLFFGEAAAGVGLNAIVCFFLLTEAGNGYRAALTTDIDRVSATTARETMFLLAGHVGNEDFLRLREMLQV